MAVTVQFYNTFLTKLVTGVIDLDSDTFKIALMTSSHTFATSTSTWASVAANELSNGSGYTTGGATLSGVTVTTSASSVSFDFTDPEWTASGGPIGPAGYAVIYDDTAANDPLICSINFGTSVTAADGADLVIRVSSAGLFRIA